MSILGFYFSPTGRIGRAKFWLGFIGLIFIVAAFKLWLLSSMLSVDPLASSQHQLTRAGLELSLLIDLIFLFPTFVVLAKRFHDRNKSGAWAVPFLLTSAAVDGGVFLGMLPSELPVDANAIKPEGAALAALSTLVILWVLIELGCLKGTSGANRFGTDPLTK